MKKATSKTITITDDIKPEYDFKHMKGGVRGKFYKQYSAGHQVKITQKDGTVTTKTFSGEDSPIVLDPDVKKYFYTSEEVNKALRCLIPLLSLKRKKLKR